MKKIFTFVFVVLSVLFTFMTPAHAQMMGKSIVATDAKQTIQDEASGKVVWDKLQNKQANCKDLKDEDFDVLGDFFMGNMMGGSHDSMNQMMAQRLGDDGEKQMHIAMGKRLSGCDSNAIFPQGSNYFMPMMGFVGGMMNNGSNSLAGSGIKGMMGYGYGNMMGNPFGIFGLLTWVALLIFLTLGSIYFWKEIQRKK